MVLKDRFLFFGMVWCSKFQYLGGCGGLERTDFEQFPLWEYGGLERTDF